jgi:hypothetical protein
MENITNNLLSWEEIKTCYPDQWVVLGDPTLEGMEVLSGFVIAHHHDKRVASIEGGQHRGVFKKFTITFTGQSLPVRRTGLLQKIATSTMHEEKASI